MKFSTRHALSDQALVELATLRGREVAVLRLLLATIESERDEALRQLRELEQQRHVGVQLSAFVNDANILASDGPGTVVHKLQAAIDRALAER